MGQTICRARCTSRRRTTSAARSDGTSSRFASTASTRSTSSLFRELYGAVTNAIYAKPFFGYDLTDAITLKIANVTSFAHKPVATPGNARGLGVEFDSEPGYCTAASSPARRRRSCSRWPP
ncbi:MAG: hypothetical protein R2939_04925 [Kofleriaceae bacterium]